MRAAARDIAKQMQETHETLQIMELVASAVSGTPAPAAAAASLAGQLQQLQQQAAAAAGGPLPPPAALLPHHQPAAPDSMGAAPGAVQLLPPTVLHGPASVPAALPEHQGMPLSAAITQLLASQGALQRAALQAAGVGGADSGDSVAAAQLGGYEQVAEHALLAQLIMLQQQQHGQQQQASQPDAPVQEQQQYQQQQQQQ
jgi:hypothetical protein